MVNRDNSNPSWEQFDGRRLTIQLNSGTTFDGSGDNLLSVKNSGITRKKKVTIQF